MRGYENGNVRIVCLRCNALKSDASPKELMDLVRYIYGENKFEAAAAHVASVVTRKNKAYGDSFGKSAEFLNLLFPNGVKPEQYDDCLTLVRIFDKMMRIATGAKDEEFPYVDINGYSLLMIAKHVADELGEAKAAKKAKSSGN